MLIIRLQRVGKKKFPTYRIIISEKTKDTQGTYLEKLGTFNPHIKENQLNIDAEKVKYWISKGAQMSETVNNLLVENKIIEGKKAKSVYLSKKRKSKLEEKDKAKVEAAAKNKAEAEAKAKAEEEAKAAAEEAVKVEAEIPTVQEESPSEVVVEEKSETEIQAPAAVVEEPKAEPAPAEESVPAVDAPPAEDVVA